MAWGWLKPIAKIGAAVAAPFTGGLSTLALPAIDAIGAGGAAGGAATDAMAANRGTQLDIEFEKLREGRMAEDVFFQAMMQREGLRDQRADTGWKRSQQADYIANRPNTPRAGVSPYTRMLDPISPEMRAMATDPNLRSQLLAQVNFADPYNGQMPTRTPDFSGIEQRRNPGLMEKILGPVSAGASVWSTMAREAERDKKRKTTTVSV